MKKQILSMVVATLFFLAGCKEDEEEPIDTEYPVMDINFTDAFPKQCSNISRGQKIIFKARFSDNIQLGSYSLDIHHNFDHHTHSTEVNACNMEPVKTPVKPFLLIQNFDIPKGLKEYEATSEIEVPADIDPGDYHFMIRLTDEEGWQAIKGLSIKIE